MGSGRLWYLIRTRQGAWPVHLTYCAEEDEKVMGTMGLSGLRRYRLLRLVNESRVQGALLGYRDLELLLLVSPATVKRDIREMRRAGIPVSVGRRREAGTAEPPVSAR